MALFSKRKGTDMEDFAPFGKKKRQAQLEPIDLVVGDGVEAAPDATVTVHYTGALCATGKIFESSHDSGKPVAFGLQQVIEGWTKGVPGMKVGGTRRLLIPSEMAYGQRRASSAIPPNSDLVFDIELVAVDD